VYLISTIYHHIEGKAKMQSVFSSFNNGKAGALGDGEMGTTQNSPN
jgi:hypothetical protein